MLKVLLLVAAVLLGVFVLLPLIVSTFLRNVEAGTIRLVSWVQGSTVIYRGPGKAKEIPLLTTGTTIPSTAINVDLDITDQTADLDESGVPRPIKVRVQASAIVSVGDSDTMIRTAANRFFSKSDGEQLSTLTDLLTSAGRRAVNLLTHDQLFSAKSSRPGVPVVPVAVTAEEDDDPLAVIIRKACSRELTDLGLAFNSLNIKLVLSEVADARREQSAAEARASAEIAKAVQQRRAQEAQAQAQSEAAIAVARQQRLSREAQLEAQRAVSDRERELAETVASNAAAIARAEAERQNALAQSREAELRATVIAEANANAEIQRIAAAASAEAEGVRIERVARAQAEAIEKVTAAIKSGGEDYRRYRQIELLPQVAPAIAGALAQARIVTVSGGAGGDATMGTMSQVTNAIQSVLAIDLAREVVPHRAADVPASGSSASPGSSVIATR